MSEEDELGYLERFAVRYLQRHADEVEDGGDAEVHVLNTEERRRLRRIEQGVVFRAAMIGALTAAVAAFVEIEVEAWLLPDPDNAGWREQLEFWLIVGPTIGVAAVVEIGLLYWDSLRSVAALARAAGLRLDVSNTTRSTKLALARAALELPNPVKGEGINAHREVSKVWLITVGLLYKLKVGITSFLLKALVRRAAGRSLVRAWLVWIGVPVTALWDAIVAWRVIREARLRAMGPSAATELVEVLFPTDGSRPALSERARITALQAVGSSIVTTHDLHPNLVALLQALEKHLGEAEEHVLDDTELFLRQMRALDEDEKLRVLEILVVGAVIDGRVTKTERELVERAQAQCGRSGLGGLKRLQRRFRRGLDLEQEHVEAALGR